jgi:hypothetical protein
MEAVSVRMQEIAGNLALYSRLSMDSCRSFTAQIMLSQFLKRQANEVRVRREQQRHCMRTADAAMHACCRRRHKLRVADVPLHGPRDP